MSDEMGPTVAETVKRMCQTLGYDDEAAAELDEACKRATQREERRAALEAALVILGIITSLCGSVLAVIATIAAAGWLL